MYSSNRPSLRISCMPGTVLRAGVTAVIPALIKFMFLWERQSTGNKVTAKIIIIIAIMQAKAFNY